MDIYTQLAEKIVKEQETIIGPVAFEQALKVPGVTIDAATHQVALSGNEKEIVENLVKQYEGLFGRTSVEVCKEATRDIVSNSPRDQIPQILL